MGPLPYCTNVLADLLVVSGYLVVVLGCSALGPACLGIMIAVSIISLLVQSCPSSGLPLQKALLQSCTGIDAVPAPSSFISDVLSSYA